MRLLHSLNRGGGGFDHLRNMLRGYFAMVMSNHFMTMKKVFGRAVCWPLIVVVVWMFGINSAVSSEPTYNGKALSEWLLVLTLQRGGHDNEIPAGMENPKEAIREIGANGIPTLLEILGAKDGTKQRVLTQLKSAGLREYYGDLQVDDLQRLAVDGFGILGTNAESAVPQLKKLFQNQDTCFEAARALIRVGPRGFSVVANALGDKDSSVRNSVIWIIGQEGGGDSNVVTQLLIKSLKDPDLVNQGNAATFLANRNPAVAIPALITLLHEDRTNFVTVTGAAEGLGSYGLMAKDAAPILLSIYTNEVMDPDRQSARSWTVELISALKAVDPDTAMKAEEFLVNSGPLGASFGCSTTLFPNGNILLAGGFVQATTQIQTNRVLAGAELFVSATRQWEKTGDMNVARYGHEAVLLPNGKVLVVGGTDLVASAKGGDLSSAELYDPTTRRWAKTSPMNFPHPNGKAILQPNGTVRMTGGWNGLKLIDDEIYDPDTEKWTVVANK